MPLPRTFMLGCRARTFQTQKKDTYTVEGKAKVLAAALGTELIQFLGALAILYQDDFEEKDECYKGFSAEWML